MTKNQELYAWYKQMGICPQCGTNKAAPNRVWCEECLAKNAESADKRRKIKPIASRKTYNKNLREQRKESGLCIWCGKPTVDGKKLCEDCYKRSCGNLPQSKCGKNYRNWKQKNELIFGNGGRE